MNGERAVFDTNVVVSAALSSTSTPAAAFERAISVGQLLASRATVRELIKTLLAPKFDAYVSHEKRDALLLRIVPLLEMVEVVQRIQGSRDLKDDKFLEVAVNGEASVLVSGDRDLLVLNPFRGIPILAPTDYLAWSQRPEGGFRR